MILAYTKTLPYIKQTIKTLPFGHHILKTKMH